MTGASWTRWYRPSGPLTSCHVLVITSTDQNNYSLVTWTGYSTLHSRMALVQNGSKVAYRDFVDIPGMSLKTSMIAERDLALFLEVR